MKNTTVSAIVIATLATPSFAADISGHIEFEQTFESYDSSSDSYGTIDAQIDIANSFSGSSFGYALGLEASSINSYVDYEDVNVFAALTFDTQFGQFLVGAPRTAIDSTISRVAPNQNTSVEVLFGENLFGREASQVVLSQDNVQQYGLAFEGTFGANGVFATSLHGFDTDYDTDITSFAVAGTNSFGNFDLGLGLELLSEDDLTVTTTVLTAAYNGPTHTIGLDVNIVAPDDVDASLTTTVLYADLDILENFTVGASYSSLSAELAGDYETLSLLGANARYNFGGGRYVKTGIAHFDNSVSDGEIFDIAFGYEF